MIPSCGPKIEASKFLWHTLCFESSVYLEINPKSNIFLKFWNEKWGLVLFQWNLILQILQTSSYNLILYYRIYIPCDTILKPNGELLLKVHELPPENGLCKRVVSFLLASYFPSRHIGDKTRGPLRDCFIRALKRAVFGNDSGLLNFHKWWGFLIFLFFF